MIEKISHHRFDQADIVRTRSSMRQQVRNLHAALAELLELALGPAQRRLRLDKRIALVADHRFRDGLAVEFDELRLEIEKLELAGPALHIQKDHPLGSCWEMRLVRGHGIACLGEQAVIQ